jgi:hypothetical protein
MENGDDLSEERLLSLKEIIQLTGHERTLSAYTMLRNHGRKPDSYRPATRAPQAEWRASVVKEVFGKHLARTARIRGISVDELFPE